jgi:hypothetical protein
LLSITLIIVGIPLEVIADGISEIVENNTVVNKVVINHSASVEPRAVDMLDFM